MKSPCKDCEHRLQGCHASCEEYAEYKRTLEQRKKRQRLDSDIQNFTYASSKRKKKLLRDRGYIK